MKYESSQQASGVRMQVSFIQTIHDLKHEFGHSVLVSDSLSQWHWDGHNWCHGPVKLLTLLKNWFGHVK